MDTTISKDRAEEMSQWRGQHPQAQRWLLGGPLHRRLTLSTYTHTTEGMKRDAADTIGSVISQTM